jgi:hypothetical protein
MFKAKVFVSDVEQATSAAGKVYRRQWVTLYQDASPNIKLMHFVRDSDVPVPAGNYDADMRIDDGKTGARPVFSNFVKAK